MGRAGDDDEPRARQRRRQRVRRRHGRRVVLPRHDQRRDGKAAQRRGELFDGGLHGDELAQDVRERVRSVLEEALAHERRVALRQTRALPPHESLARRDQPVASSACANASACAAMPRPPPAGNDASTSP